MVGGNHIFSKYLSDLGVRSLAHFRSVLGHSHHTTSTSMSRAITVLGCGDRTTSEVKCSHSNGQRQVSVYSITW